MKRGEEGSDAGRTLRRFLHETRAGATAIAAVAVTVMTVGASALIIDHVWLVDQRDVLKSAADAAAVAATLEMERELDRNPEISDGELHPRRSTDMIRRRATAAIAACRALALPAAAALVLAGAVALAGCQSTQETEAAAPAPATYEGIAAVASTQTGRFPDSRFLPDDRTRVRPPA